jgi:hypothetical protein
MRIPIYILAAAAICRAAEPAEGRWEGAIQIPGDPLTVIVDLAQNPEGWTGSATVPGFTKGAQLTDIAVQGPAVSFTLKGALGEPRFRGRVDADGTLTGEFAQAGHTAAFLLRKAGPPQVDLPRQSTAVSAELEGEWQGDLTLNGNRLKATLKLANEAGKATAKLVVAGKRETNIPIDLVRQEGDFLTLVCSPYHMSWEGSFRKEAKELTGAFTQGPIETPLLFVRKP